jgi:hypothetical protein
MITDQKEFFPEGVLEMSVAEAVKYGARLRDEYGKLDPRPNFGEWLSDRIFDAGDRLRLAGMLCCAEKLAALAEKKVKILKIKVSAGPVLGDVHWEIVHDGVPSQAVAR